MRASLVGLASAWVMPVVEYPNGDVAQYLDLCFLCRHESGEPSIGDDESLEVGWFSPDALPESLSESSRHKLQRALAFDGSTWFESAVPPAASPARAAPATVSLGGAPAVSVRRATREDVPAIVALLADDSLGVSREDTADLSDYLAAFERVDADPAHLLVVADDGREVVATLQLSVIPSLSRRGALRAQIEAVRVAGSQRGRGLGQARTAALGGRGGTGPRLLDRPADDRQVADRRAALLPAPRLRLLARGNEAGALSASLLPDRRPGGPLCGAARHTSGCAGGSTSAEPPARARTERLWRRGHRAANHEGVAGGGDGVKAGRRRGEAV